MRLNWFKDPDNIVYADINEFAENFGNEIGVENLRAKLEAFAANPTDEGMTITGTKRTSVKVFIPDRVFPEHIEMGENVWIYMGESYECYCIYGLEVKGA